MRILATSDLHGDHGAYSWMVQVAASREPDAVVLAGDLLGGPPGFETIEAAQAHDAAAVLGILRGISCPVLYVMGNDDMIELPPGPAHVASVHGRRIDIGGCNFVGYQYSLPFMAGVFEKLDAEIKRDLLALEPLVDERTVFITHSPAYGVLDRVQEVEHAGSRSLLDFIHSRRPRVHLHGHIHAQAGRQGRHWNLAAYRHKRAVLIDLETLEDEILEG